MIYYSYNVVTGEFTGSGNAFPNPAFGEEMQPEFLFPADTTEIAPPEVSTNQAAVFTSGSWNIVSDYRGDIGYTTDGNAVYVRELGKTIEDLGLLRVRPDPIPIPTATKEELLAQLAELSAKIQALE